MKQRASGTRKTDKRTRKSEKENGSEETKTPKKCWRNQREVTNDSDKYTRKRQSGIEPQRFGNKPIRGDFTDLQ